MAGTNPEPAETMNVVDVIRDLFTPEYTAAVAVEVAKVLEPRSNTTAETRTFELTANTPVLLLGYDRARVRTLLRASVDDVFIGSAAQLSGGLGYPLPQAAGDEVKTIEEVYVAYIPQGAPEVARVTAWIERRV